MNDMQEGHIDFHRDTFKIVLMWLLLWSGPNKRLLLFLTSGEFNL